MKEKELMERFALELVRAKEEAMAAGYAQGVEATEAMAIKRITELVNKIKELQKRDRDCDCENPILRLGQPGE